VSEVLIGIVGRHKQQRVAVRRGIDRCAAAMLPPDRRDFPHELLAETLDSHWPHDARHGIARAAGR